MKTLIVYATKYGSTEKCAKLLSGKLSSEVKLCNLKLEKNIDLSKYDKVIIGTSVYMGRVRKEINEFFISNSNELITKKVRDFSMRYVSRGRCCYSNRKYISKRAI